MASAFFGQDKFFKTDQIKFGVVKCSSCGLVFLNPQPTEIELKKYYPSDYGPFQDNFELLKYGPFLKWFKNNFNQLKRSLLGDRIDKVDLAKKSEKMAYLDFGCGSGTHLQKIKRLNPSWDIYGLDNNDLACVKAQEKGFKIFSGESANNNLPVDFFDYVYMGQVIEHLNDPKAVLSTISKSMKTNGELILLTPNLDSWAARFFKSYWFALETPRHLFFFTPGSISLLLEQTGFKVEKIDYDREPKTFIRSFRYLLGLKNENINPLFWHVLWYLSWPISRTLSFFGKTSIMTIQAKKL